MESVQLLPPAPPHLPETVRRRLADDFERFRGELPPDFRVHCCDAYGVDIAGEYGGGQISNPFGKASGQLSLNTRQVQRDAECGLGFLVLKTVIAQDEQGQQAMSAWAIRETRMRLDPITGGDGTPGWTITWKGRGWHDTFEQYLQFFGEALDVAAPAGMRIAPSVKYHLPGVDETGFSRREYEFTTRSLLDVWRARRVEPMPLEKDFSPTLAGDDRSRQEAQILHWLREVPELIRSSTPGPIALGVKLMNAQADLAFQVEMVRVLLDEAGRPPDYLVYANRLFDPTKEFEGKVGVAYGGPDLSRRNLTALRAIGKAREQGTIRRPLPPISGTGDILNGRTAIEYGLLGATSCQMHTLFQLPDTAFAATMRNKSAAVLHHLLLHPETGLLAWLLHLGIAFDRVVNWRDLPALGRELLAAQS